MTTECKASSSEEPGAGIPHAGICAGGARQRASLPRYPRISGKAVDIGAYEVFTAPSLMMVR